MLLWNRPFQYPVRNLFILSVAWKLLLLLVAAFSPGPGYDTSTTLILPSRENLQLPSILRHIVNKLTRWDAIYFTQTARRGYLFEQEWAFGWGFSRVISFGTTALETIGVAHYEGFEALVAISIAHVSHILSVLLMYYLTRAVFPRTPSGFAFTAAALYIIAPAGLFLSSPFAESSCALLSFAGHLLFSKSFVQNGDTTNGQDLLVLLSGVCFGIATTFRSNAILNGLLLLEEAFRILVSLRSGVRPAGLRRLMITGLGGMTVATGFLLPQYIGYKEYCTDNSPRPWCGESFPSIYTFVQDHYWNVGLFRYWTISNIPLFLLATPMLTLMTVSGTWALDVFPTQASQLFDILKETKEVEQVRSLSGTAQTQILRNLAVSQLVLALLTLTTAHVQIITRISSAYPVWLWFTAALCLAGNRVLVKSLVAFMVMYALIQGGLFASFLPPA